MMCGDFASLKDFSLSVFGDFKADLGERYPNFRIQWGGEPTQFSLSVLISDAPLDRPDLVELEVHLAKDYEGNNLLVADVVWGDGDGSLEASEEVSLQSGDPFTQMAERIPFLVKVLEAAAVRGVPCRWPR